jgi:hypothetical protein
LNGFSGYSIKQAITADQACFVIDETKVGGEEEKSMDTLHVFGHPKFLL